MFPYIFRSEDIATEGNSNHMASSCSSSSTSTINSEPVQLSGQNLEMSDRNNKCDEGVDTEEVQQGFLSGYRRDYKKERNQNSKSLFGGATNGIENSQCQYSPHHDRNSSDSNSSTEESHSRRVALMMASPALPPRSDSCREKQRRRTRASSRRTSDGAKSGPSEPLCSDEYGKSYENNDVRSPIAVRRRSSKLPSGAIAPSSKRRFSSQDTKRPTKQSYDDFPLRKPHHSEYYSPDFSSESSPDSSPSRLISDMYRLDQYQHHTTTSQGQLSSKNNLSRSANDSFTGSTDSYYSKFNSRKSSIKKVPSSKNLKTVKTNPITSNKYCSLAGTFLGIVLISINGMIFLTERAAPTTIQQEQFVASLFNLPDDGGLRGKQVLGRMWDTSATNSEDLSSSIKERAQKSESVNISRPSTFRNVAISSTRQPEVKQLLGASTSPNWLQMHAPPSLSSTIDSKFDSFDRNLYYSSSTSRNGKKADFLPRIVMLDPVVKKVSRKIKIYPADFTDNTQLYGILPSDDERLSRMEIRDPYTNNECVPMQEWQTTYQPSCNGIHELALDSLGASTRINEDKSLKRLDRGRLEGLNASLFGTNGFWRYAWKVVIAHNDHRKAEEDTVVFKNLKYEHNFEDAHFEHDRIDAVAMERLTSSPHVINIFGFCGHSVMTEYADGKRIGELADKSKKTPLKRLEIARDIANGLADVHGIDGDGNATFVHLDINPANVVSVNNSLKLNDFNIGIIRQWNTTSNEACGFPTQYPNPQWRSPEEARNEQHLTEKVDVFSLGHIFFRLICGHEPWNKLEPGVRPTKAEINEKVQRGELPFIPDHVRSSNDPEIIAVRDIMLQCYSFDPADRPSARYIANTLDRTLNDLKQKYSSKPFKK